MVAEGLLDGRVAVVTGGGAGIGRGVCRRLVAEGALVVVNDIDSDRLDETETEVRSTSSPARGPSPRPWSSARQGAS